MQIIDSQMPLDCLSQHARIDVTCISRVLGRQLFYRLLDERNCISIRQRYRGIGARATLGFLYRKNQIDSDDAFRARIQSLDGSLAFIIVRLPCWDRGL